MTSQERVWFDQLASKRANAAAVFADPDYSGFWNSVVEKYSDNAHFICELLQNADDAGATEASFELNYGQGVVFRHNGGKRFTISNPATSHNDQINGVLGCVNAITAIGQSEKIVEEKAGNQIGKFGIGFKSVFRYTETPQIYDDNVCFYLHSKIVPVLLVNDYPLRKRGETVFVLPLNKQGLDFDVASREIEDSVKKLQFPTLFLNHLVRISVRIFNANEVCLDVIYIKQQLDCKIENIPSREVIGTCLIRLCKEDKIAKTSEVVDVRTMVRANAFGLPYAVGFAVDQNGRPRPLPLQNAYCYFRTDVQTGLPFLVHAPFRLTDNRQGFLSDPINADLLMRLAILSADAMLLFRDWKLLDESIFAVFPSDLVRKKVLPLFEVFLRPFVNLLQQEAIYPTATGYISRQNAKWAATKELMDLLPLEKLQKLTNRESDWVFPKCYAGGSDAFAAEIRTWLDISRVAIKFTGETLLNSITANHIKCFGIGWLNLLYGYVLKNTHLTRNAMLSPIIVDDKGNVVAAKNGKGENRVYLPIENVECDLPTVNFELMKQNNAITFFKRIGLCEPSRMDAIKKIITDKLQNAQGREEYNRLFKQVLDFYIDQKYAERQVLVKLLQENPCIAVKDFDDIGKDVGCSLMGKGETVYFPNDELAKYFKAFGVRCVDFERYVAMTGDEAVVDSLLTKIGVFKDVRFWRNSKGEPCINMCMANLRRIMSLPVEEQKQLSVVIWRILCNVVNRWCSKAISFQQLMTCVYSNAKAPSPTLQMLRSTKWLINDDGAMVAPNEVWRENLAAEYGPTSWQSIQIIEALQIKRNPELVAIETLTDENRAALDLGQKLRAAGFDKEVGAGVSAEKLGLLFQLEEKFTEEEIKRLLNDRTEAKRSNSNVAGDAESPSVDDGQQLQGGTEESDAGCSDARFTEEDAKQMKRVFGNNLTDAAMNDINRIDCIRLFNSLIREGYEPRMLLGRDECQIECEYGDDSEDDSKRVEKVEKDFVADVYNRRISRRSSMKDTRGTHSSTIETKDGRQIHVIGAIGGVAHLPPKWWNRIAGQGCPENAKYIVCAIVSHRENGFRYLRTRDDLMKALGDNFSVVRVQSESREDRFEKTCSLFSTNPEQSDYSTYALLLFHGMDKKYSYEGVFKVDFENITEAECNGEDDSEYGE